jgi:serine/threonine-protein phosphatase 5
LQNKRKRRPPSKECQLGSLQDLRGSGKGGLDPNGRGSTVVATDVLWSDPVAVPGLHLNVSRGVGVVFGPDITQVGNLCGNCFL